jgi:predicted unusual protein kinase regulating ubiquinone biosynthesis (AarF/ABC1/UbiB family)
MKEQTSIPISKIHRASKFVYTGAKVGSNYLKYYKNKLLLGEDDRQGLDEDNAEDIYNSLSELKGSALKAAQMLSMDQSLLPTAYVDKFQMAQYSAPPLSYPLVVRTFQKYFGKKPTELFDTFHPKASNAASIGQVHLATFDGKKLAIKVQYPGVAGSVKNDLKMVKPFAARIMNLKVRDLDKYMEEVESKLLEEADYHLELKRSQEITDACRHQPNLVFPTYYPERSCGRVLTMDWIDGQHLREWLKTKPSQEVRNRIGQAMWDFYNFQIHQLKKVHADPHPGNFIITPENQLAVIDFGCVKEIPNNFYSNYFQLLEPEILSDQKHLEKLFYRLRFLYTSDTIDKKKAYFALFLNMIKLLGRPFHGQQFDFKDKAYFDSIFTLANQLSKSPLLRKSEKPRGSEHGIYINRTYFGLYTLLHELGAKVNIARLTLS